MKLTHNLGEWILGLLGPAHGTAMTYTEVNRTAHVHL